MCDFIFAVPRQSVHNSFMFHSMSFSVMTGKVAAGIFCASACI